MSAAFHLVPIGPPSRCGFPGCILQDYHEGDHQFRQPQPKPRGRRYHCIVCGRDVIEYGEFVPGGANLCESKDCLLHYARRTASDFPLTCSCRQRPYPHELIVHQEVRAESHNPRFRHLWPWSLCLSERLEPSTERKFV